jgi:hypothetical protein
MAQIEQDINTGSTGALGLEFRSFDRYYLNSPYGVLEEIGLLERYLHMGRDVIQRERHGATRCVARTLVSESVLGEMIQHPFLSTVIEAAVPTGIDMASMNGSTGEVWMVLNGLNHSRRQSPYTVEQIVHDVELSRRDHKKSPLQRTEELLSQGYLYTSTIPTNRIDEVVNLWGPTFGWAREGVAKLQERLVEEQQMERSQRAVWFSGLIDSQGLVVSIATGELLNMPLGNGGYLPVVESTEWRRIDSVHRHGLMAATVSHLHAQVFRDLEGQNPLIIAETNYWSGAHNVGFAAGMDVAPREIAGGKVPQTLMQNVAVGDGIEPSGLRDFTMMYVPIEARERLYNKDICAAMLQEGVV